MFGTVCREWKYLLVTSTGGSPLLEVNSQESRSVVAMTVCVENEHRCRSSLNSGCFLSDSFCFPGPGWVAPARFRASLGVQQIQMEPLGSQVCDWPSESKCSVRRAIAGVSTGLMSKGAPRVQEGSCSLNLTGRGMWCSSGDWVNKWWRS